MKKIYIGIDPDCHKSGVANIDDENNIILNNLTFFDLFDYLQFQKNKIAFEKNELIVVVEAGWLNKSNWHTSQKFSSSVNAKIGNSTGANHETGRKIVEMLEYLNIKYELKKPIASKVNSLIFSKITGIKRSNQEQRDAFMLIFKK